MEKWVGKYAVVTGASLGIGAAITEELVRNGVNVIALARKEERLQELKEKHKNLKGKIIPKTCDVSNESSINEAFQWIEKNFNTIDILVNNAGTNYAVQVTDTSDDVTRKINETIATNFTGLVHVTRSALKLMKKTENFTMIININSTSGLEVSYTEVPLSVYPPTKYALTALSEVMRHEFTLNKCDKIRVTNISPGMVATGIFIGAGYTDNLEEFYKMFPFIQPSDVANAVIYALSTPTNVNVTNVILRPVGETI